MEIAYVFVDDERDIYRGLAPYDIIITCRDYDSTIDTIDFLINTMNCKVCLDLDHDLGEGKTGYDICKFIVEHEIPIEHVYLHTMNPVGRQNMYQLLSHYNYRVTID